MVEEGIDESAVWISWGRVNDHSVLFVDDNEVFIFVEHLERDILRGCFERDGFWQSNACGVAGLYWIAGFGRLSIDEDELLANERLDSCAREARQGRREPCVQAVGRGVRADFHAAGFLRPGMVARGKRRVFRRYMGHLGVLRRCGGM